jgi:glycerol-3-phosphate O-acyltransferase
LVRKLIGRWVRVTIKPDDAAAMLAARPRPVCYVLERESQTDLAVLGMVCAELGLPTPVKACFELGARTPRHLVSSWPRPPPIPRTT